MVSDRPLTSRIFDTAFDFYIGALSVLSPARAQKNLLAREHFLRSYDSASTTNRFRRNRTVTDGNANAEILNSNALGNIRKFSRDAYRNNALARAISRALEANIVGTGFELQAAATDKDGKLMLNLNKKVERLWRMWCEDCDAAGRKNFYDFQRQAIRQMLQTGEFIVHDTSKGGSFIPYKIESIESDLLDAQYSADNLRIIGGVKVDIFGAPVTYYISKTDKGPYNIQGVSLDYYEIPASEICHIFIEDRPYQVRGEPWLAPALDLLLTAGRAVEAELYALEIQSCLAVLYTNKSGTRSKFLGSQTDSTDGNGDKINRLSPGMIGNIPGADSVTVVDPKRPGNTFSPFIDKIIQYVAAAVGLSYPKITKDYSQGNFSGQRMCDMDDTRHIQIVQEFLSNNFCKKIYAKFFDQCVLSGFLTSEDVPDYSKNRSFYHQSSFVAQPKQYIDPLKDVAAIREQLNTGVLAFQDYCSSVGKDWREEMQKNAEIQSYAKELGINFLNVSEPVSNPGMSNMTKGSTTGPTDTTGDDIEDDEEKPEDKNVSDE